MMIIGAMILERGVVLQTVVGVISYWLLWLW